MTKLDKLNKLLADRTLDIPAIHRTVDRNGSNIVWLRKHLGKRNSSHPEFQVIDALLNEQIGVLVNQAA